MWRCLCGHAFYSALPPNCPSCDRVVDADVEETVTVDGRKLPFRVWEAEVLVRAAGWAVVLRGVAFLLGGLLLLAQWVGTPSWDPASFAVPLAMGLILTWQGRATFLRGRSSRWVMVSQSFITLTALACTGILLGVSRTFESQWRLLAPAFAGQFAIDIFTLYVVFSTGGDWVWDMSRPGEAMAPLSSAWTVGRSLRAWAALGIVSLALLATALLVYSLTPWSRT